MLHNLLKMSALLCIISFLFCTQVITISAPELEKADVQDTTPPKISFGNDTVFITLGETYTYQTATAWDLVDGDVPVTYSGTVDITKAGTYLITYTATDKSNNIATRIKMVIVEDGLNNDIVVPELTLKGKDTIYVSTFTQFVEPGVSAIDNYDGVITSKVKIDYGQFISGAAAGVYLIKYSVQDDAGNSTTKFRYVYLNCESTRVKNLLN